VSVPCQVSVLLRPKPIATANVVTFNCSIFFKLLPGSDCQYRVMSGVCAS
jgi:hypothetical protein